MLAQTSSQSSVWRSISHPMWAKNPYSGKKMSELCLYHRLSGLKIEWNLHNDWLIEEIQLFWSLLMLCRKRSGISRWALEINNTNEHERRIQSLFFLCAIQGWQIVLWYLECTQEAAGLLLHQWWHLQILLDLDHKVWMACR